MKKKHANKYVVSQPIGTEISVSKAVVGRVLLIGEASFFVCRLTVPLTLKTVKEPISFR